MVRELLTEPPTEGESCTQTSAVIKSKSLPETSFKSDVQVIIGFLFYKDRLFKSSEETNEYSTELA